MTPERSLFAWKASATLLYLGAILASLCRLSRRYGTGGLWWDDSVLVCSILLGHANMFLIWFAYAYPGSSQSVSMKGGLYWSISVVFLCLIWSTWLSITLSFTRTLAARRRQSFNLGPFPVVGLALSLMVLFVWGCIHDETLQFDGKSNCNDDRRTLLIFNTIVADLSGGLILMPTFYAVMRLNPSKVSPLQRRFNALLLFGGTMMVFSAVPIFIVYFVSRNSAAGNLPVALDMTSQIGGAVSLFACNIPIIFLPPFNSECPRESDAEAVHCDGATNGSSITLTDLQPNKVIVKDNGSEEED